ncbi:MAG: hypothetical protein ABIO80_04545 [Sphingomicrobium sp.]
MLEMVLVATVGGGSAWGPPRMIAAMVMGREVLPPPATFALVPMTVAMMIHFVLSIILAAVLGWIISKWRLSLTSSIITSALFGLLIYVVNFYGFTAVWPWFAMARGWISIFAHAMFGLVLGWAYHAIAAPRAEIHPRTADVR